ncbi:MAG: hypothetical protein K8W52_02790 [Deltaproteobacteria bacterium]|nr:hypothetical protein [Deltaproteobacteria bacterium]
MALPLLDEHLRTPDDVARLCARRTPDWQLAAMTPIEEGRTRGEVVLRIEWHDGHGWGGEPRNIDGFALTVRGVSHYALAGPHEPGTTIGRFAPAARGVGLVLGVPGSLEVVGEAIELRALPTRQEIAAIRLNPGRITVDAPTAWRWGAWREALAAHGADAILWAEGDVVDDPRQGAEPGTAWAIYLAGTAHDGASGIWLQWQRGGAGTHATAVRHVRCPDTLWQAMRAALGDLDGARIICGNARFDAAAWRASLVP